MQREHYEQYLAKCYTLEVSEQDKVTGDIGTGTLIPRDTARQSAKIVNGIPRFVPQRNYAENFGLQWNLFHSAQLDSHLGKPISFNRFWNSTRWKPKDLFGKTVLEAGSGAGRFTEILLDAGAKVVSFDFSNAVDANYSNNKGKGDLFLFQGDIYDLPLDDQQFDFVFCYGVLQHTPDPVRTYQCLFRKLKLDGRLSIDVYMTAPYPNSSTTAKYFWRPITSKMDPRKLLKIVQFYVPLWRPIDTFFRHIPFFGPAILTCLNVPCANYVGFGLSRKQRHEWAILDTFDMLGAAYDTPMTVTELRALVTSPENDVSCEVFPGSNGVVANVTRKA